MVKLVVGQSKKNGNKYYAIVFIKENGNKVYLSFDFVTALKVTGLSVDELTSYELGEYNI